MVATRKPSAKTKAVPASVPPERVDLAEATAAVTRARRGVQAAQAAEQRAAALVAAAEDEVAAAEAGVAEAKAGTVAALAKAVGAGKKAPASATKAARQRFTDALDALDVAREAHAALRNAVNPAHADLSRAKVVLDATRAAALRPAGLRLADEIEALRGDLERKIAVLSVLHVRGAFKGPPQFFGEHIAYNYDNPEQKRIWLILENVIYPKKIEALRAEGEALAVAALAALEADPAAEVKL